MYTSVKKTVMCDSNKQKYLGMEIVYGSCNLARPTCIPNIAILVFTLFILALARITDHKAWSTLPQRSKTRRLITAF